MTDDVPPGTAPLEVSPRAAFTRGLVTNLTNVKVLIFYLSFFPQFMGTATSAFAQLELLAWVFIALALAWEALVVVLAARMQHLMRRPTFALCLDGLCTLVFLALGLVVLAEAAGLF